MMHQLIKVVSVALAAFMISYLVAGVFERLGFDPGTWYFGLCIILITLVLIFALLSLFHLVNSKRAK
mgnify:CR=1 FL=1